MIRKAILVAAVAVAATLATSNECKHNSSRRLTVVHGAGVQAIATTSDSITTPTCTTHKTSTVTNTIAAATVCITDIHLRCKSQSTIANGTTIIHRSNDITGAISSSSTYSKSMIE